MYIFSVQIRHCSFKKQKPVEKENDMNILFITLLFFGSFFVSQVELPDESFGFFSLRAELLLLPFKRENGEGLILKWLNGCKLHFVDTPR